MGQGTEHNCLGVSNFVFIRTAWMTTGVQKPRAEFINGFQSKGAVTMRTSQSHSTPGEVIAVLKAAKERCARDWAVVLLAYRHGMRASENNAEAR